MYLQYMDELSQIIKHEEENKDRLSLAEKSAKEEIEEKERKLKERLLKESVLTDAEKAGLLAEKERKMNKIEQDTKEKLESELKDLEKVDKKRALEYINKSLSSD